MSQVRSRAGAKPWGWKFLGVCCLVIAPVLALPGMSYSDKDPGPTPGEPKPALTPPTPPPVLLPDGGGLPPGGSFPGGGFSGGPGGGGFPGGSGFRGKPFEFPASGPGFGPGFGPGTPAFIGGTKEAIAVPAGFTPMDPSTPVRELLPPHPQTLLSRPRHLLPGSLEQVTEVAFQEPIKPEREKALAHTKLIASKIFHLHNRKADSYMEELIAARPDLQGMPFVLGGACRANHERMLHFTTVLQFIRNSMPGEFNGVLTEATMARRESNDAASNQFWQNFNNNMIPRQTEVDRSARPKSKDMFREAHVAALMQVCGPEQGAMRRGLTRHVAGVAHAESSRALAKLAIFSPEEDVRRDAIDSLKIRRDKDYGDILAGGLRYPWPEVARRATEAIVALERKDLLPALVNALDEPDPRLPRETTVKGKKAHVVDEMVRVNHHRNCFLCHAPADGSGEVLSGAVPIPGEPLPSFQDGYRNSTPELAVRIDVTYLRQDFSTFMKVENANPWPEMQRFDFLVRTRTVAGEEMEAFTKLSASAEEGVLNPYHRAAVNALRELTGRDAAPTAEAWRRLLKLPARGS